MKTMIISDFKAKCIAVLKGAQQDGQAVTVTWRGQPIARVEPILGVTTPRRFGALKGKLRIQGDIVNTDWSSDWDDGR